MVAPTKVKRRFIAQQGGGQQNGSAGQLFAGDSECEFFIKWRSLGAWRSFGIGKFGVEQTKSVAFSK